MNYSAIVYGPPSAGMWRHAERLAAFFGVNVVMREVPQIGWPEKFNHLYLCHQMPPYWPQGVRVFHWYVAAFYADIEFMGMGA